MFDAEKCTGLNCKIALRQRRVLMQSTRLLHFNAYGYKKTHAKSGCTDSRSRYKCSLMFFNYVCNRFSQ